MVYLSRANIMVTIADINIEIGYLTYLAAAFRQVSSQPLGVLIGRFLTPPFLPDEGRFQQ